MAVVDVYNLKKEFGGQLIFEGISFSVNSKDKVAIIGNNGTGKTTLLRLLTKEIDKDDGSISFSSNLSVGYLSQRIISDDNNSLFLEMEEVFNQVISIEKRLALLLNQISQDPNNKSLLDEYGKLESRFLAMNGYDYHYLIDMILSKFKFSKEDYNRPIMPFSGGERSKIAFAKLLLKKPGLLLLDEPTNHLDLSTILWLEEYLKNYDGTIILVSHDRYFIDNVCDRVFELANKKLEIYEGNYSYYLQDKVNRYEQQLEQYKLQQKEIDNLVQLIARFKPKPTKVRLARDREKKLERIKENLITRPTNSQKKVNFKLQDNTFNRVRQLTIEDLGVGYNHESLVSNISFEVFYGDKIAIIGNNGTGKTTLLKTLNGTLPLINGKVVKHRSIKIGYIDQNQINISSPKSIFDYFSDIFPLLDNTAIRTHLGSFLFQGDDVFKSINVLSGGEKVRVSFAILVMKKYDILLLDEPTNHLDIDTRKILESTLKDYSGTIIFISHDRYFIDEIATKIALIDEKRNFRFFDLSYQEYLDLVKEETVQITQPSSSKPKKTKQTIDNSSENNLEALILKQEQELNRLHQLLYQEEIYQDLVKLKEVEIKITENEAILKELEEAYFASELSDEKE